MKKKNTSKQGTDWELLAFKVLDREGHKVQRVVKNVVITKAGPRSITGDYFGAVDLIAKLRPDAPVNGQVHEHRTRWIQVTGGRDIGRKKQKLATVPWNKAHDSVEIWRYIDDDGKELDGRNGQPRQTLYFQVYHLDDDYAMRKGRRIPARMEDYS